MLTVPEAARRVGKNPETVRRWIRSGRLPAHKVGTQHVIEEAVLVDLIAGRDERLSVPESWRETSTGEPMPNVVTAVSVAPSGREVHRRRLTVPEAARRLDRNPETVRRWIREGTLRATKIGTQYFIDPAALGTLRRDTLPAPAWWDETESGRPMPDWVTMLHRQRAGH